MSFMDDIKNFISGKDDPIKEAERKAYEEERLKLAPQVGKERARQEALSKKKALKGEKKSGSSGSFMGDFQDFATNFTNQNENPFGYSNKKPHKR